MGIPGLFKIIRQKYKDTIFWNAKQNIDYFFLDYNCLMYPIIGKYLKNNRQKAKGLTKARLETVLVNEVIKYTAEMVTKHIKPQQLLYIAMDGSAPYSKMYLQRFRRYKSIKRTKYINHLRDKYDIAPTTLVDNTEVWDTANITPGTKFMEKLSKALTKAIKAGKFDKHLTTKAKKDKLEIIFSDSNVPGEGEHKIMKHIREMSLKKTNTLCIYSEDADFIVLCFPFNSAKMLILRNLDKDMKKEHPDAPYIYFDSHKFRDAIIDRFSWKDLDPTRVVYDYMFLSFLAGNDFVKPIPFLKENKRIYGKDGITRTLDFYNRLQGVGKYEKLSTKSNNKSNNKNKRQYLVDYDEKTQDVQINTNMFKKLIGTMAGFGNEDRSMKQVLTERKQAKKRAKQKSDNKAEKNKDPSYNINLERNCNYNDGSGDNKVKDPKLQKIEDDLSNFEHNFYFNEDNPFYLEASPLFNKIDYNLPYPKWKEQYYEHFFMISPKINSREYNYYRAMVSREYIKSLLFTLKYYINGTPPDWRWAYTFRVSPLVSDIHFVLSKYNNVNELANTLNNKSKPFAPFEQLMMVLPPTKADLLPASYSKLITLSSSPIIEYYPTDFKLDILAGEKYIYSEPLLPEIDISKVLKAIKPLHSKLSKTNKERNKLSNNIVTNK
jgi:5'-3' exonuclease